MHECVCITHQYKHQHTRTPIPTRRYTYLMNTDLYWLTAQKLATIVSGIQL